MQEIVAMNRREWCQGAAATLLGMSFPLADAAGGEDAQQQSPRRKNVDADGVWNDRRIPTAGSLPQGLKDLDAVVTDEMKLLDIPGVVVAVSFGRQLIVDRAYGYRDEDWKKPTQTATLMRTASIMKIFNLSLMDLIFQQGWKLKSGKLVTPDLPALKVMQDEWGVLPPEGMSVQSGIDQITLQQLMDHRSGITDAWRSGQLEQDMHLTQPATRKQQVQWLLCQPLMFEPGAKEAYSNNGHFLLTCFIQALTGDYVKYAQRFLFSPAGANEFVKTRAKPEERDPKETQYWTKAMGPSPFAEDGGAQIPTCDGGGRNIDNEIHLAVTARTLVRYLDCFYFASGKRLFVREEATGGLKLNGDNGANEFIGSDDGTYAQMEQNRFHGLNTAVLCNRRIEKEIPNGHTPLFKRIIQTVKLGLGLRVRASGKWGPRPIHVRS